MQVLHTRSQWFLAAGTLVILFIETGCVPEMQQYFNATVASPSLLQNVVCDPFGGSGSTGNTQNGVLASLTYLPGNSSEVAAGNLTTASFLTTAPGVVSEPNPIILNQLNVPTVDFSDGFMDSNGHTLEDLQGNELIEWFSLHMDAKIMLNAGDTAGQYQFGVLSDDGSILSIAPDGSTNLQTWINNDGEHGNTLGCAVHTVTMVPGQAIPMHLDYFQGPRYRIAMILMWRLNPNPANLVDPECGVTEGDTSYFTSSGAGVPIPTDKYEALLSRGWAPVPAANLYLENGTVNPCTGS